VFLVGGGAHSAAVRRIAADLLGRPVTIPVAEELVATGAALQAAAVVSGRPLDDLGVAWGLGSGTTVEPDLTVDRGAVREAYDDAVASRSMRSSATRHTSA
jgi:xylulokinase